MITDLPKTNVKQSASDSDTDSLGRLPEANQSKVAGFNSESLWHKTIPEMLADTVEHYGSREAVIFPEHNLRWTYKDLLTEVETLAAGFLSLGLQKGDRVAIWSPNRPEWVVTQYATAQLGLILVTINPAYRIAELEYALNKVECKAIVTASTFKSSNYIEMLQSLAPELDQCEPGQLQSKKLPHLKTIIRMGDEQTPGMLNFNALREMGADAGTMSFDDIVKTLKPDDAINIQFTSGTTGAPKGATLTHTNIVNNGRYVVSTMNFTEQDRLCIPVPLYHCFGMVMGSLGCVSAGAAMIYSGEAFEPEATLAAVEKERCTALYGVPTMFLAMLEHENFANYSLSSLRTGIMAGAPCPIEVMKRVVNEMHMSEVTIAYGMTETSPVSFQTNVDDPVEKKVSTVGRVHPHVEVKIIDEQGGTVSVGEKGELCTRGYSVMHGYWNDQEKTEQSIDKEGWMHTGDLAVLDSEGYCNIVGRVKDMLIRGGENIYPREIEEYLFRHPKIQQVQVFGVPDEKYGEEVCAWVVVKEKETLSEEEVKAFCQGQIAHYKIPRYIRFKSALPMTVTGKPQKFIMREEMIKEISASS